MCCLHKLEIEASWKHKQMAHALCVSMFSCVCNGDEIRPIISTIFTWLWADPFIEIWNPKLEGGGRVDLQLKPKCVPPVFLFFRLAMWERGGLTLQFTQEWAMKKSAQSTCSDHLISLCIYASVQLCWSTLSVIKSSCEENASQSQFWGKKEKRPIRIPST